MHAHHRFILSLLPGLLVVGLLGVFAGVASAAGHQPPAALPEGLWGDALHEDGAWVEPAARIPRHGLAAAKSAAPPSVRWAVLQCAFPGSSAYPLTSAQTLRLFEKPDVGLLAFFDRQAQGRTSMSVAWVQQVTLPMSQPGYWGQATSSGAFITRATNDCLGLVAAQRSLDDITGLVVFFNDVIDCCAYGGPFTMTLPGGVTRRVPGVWLPPAAHTQPLVIAHEMAHGFGIQHSNNTDRDPDTTDNHWDLMSNIKLNRQVDPEIGPLPRGFHAYHRDTLGWLDDAAVTDVQVGEGDDRTIETVLTADGLLHLHFTSTTGVVVSYRGANHPDEGERTTPAVFVDELDTMRSQPLWVVDEALPIPTVASTASSHFTAGESWAVEDATPGRAVLVEVVSVAPTEASVRVHLGPPPPPVAVFHDNFESPDGEL